MNTAQSATRRLVAVALTDVDVLTPGSDLRHVAGAVSEVDVLIARCDPPGPLPGSSPLDAEDYPDDDGLDIDGIAVGGVAVAGIDGGAVAAGTVEAGPVEGGPGEAVPDGAGPGRGRDEPSGRRSHRLGLRWTVQDRDEPDLVAAMCELVGFDPDDRVFLLAPAAGADELLDPELAVLLRAVHRVARVYGLPVLRYRRVADEAGPVPEMPAPPIACGS